MLNTKMVTNSKWPVGRNDWGFATAISACGSERAASCSGRATSGRTQRKSTAKQPALGRHGGRRPKRARPGLQQVGAQARRQATTGRRAASNCAKAT